MNEVKDSLGVGLAQWGAYTNMLETLAATKLDIATASSVMHKVFQITPEVSAENAVKVGHVAKVIDLFSGKAIGYDLSGPTGWGLVNATTEYLDKYKRARSQGNRLDSAWFGESFNLKQRAVDECLLLAA
jgi:hypothetical protein